ncbi:hypothetical protein D3C75_910560 [compost metagenome]
MLQRPLRLAVRPFIEPRQIQMPLQERLLLLRIHLYMGNQLHLVQFLDRCGVLG